MASTSTSSIQKSFKYDVFLSFRGEDTRKNFVDHLYHALHQKCIHTYKDDERIQKGKMISDELIRSIEDSKFYIIVFSKNYASSSWCLDELVKIMECQKMIEHTAYPVFYDVEPTEVRKQSGSVGEAFHKHEKEEAAGKWRDALKDAAELAGWELKSTFNGHEAKLIQKIVQEISLELRFINSSFDEKLVGMETRVKDVVSSLETCADDVCMLGIWGMGGAGKTTLARAVFDQISIWFEGSSFVENVREVSKRSSSGLKKLQKQVLSDVLNDEKITVSGVYDGRNKMKKLMHGKKVLVVLDDVDHKDQLDALAGETSWFKPGSKIIITTRDKQVLVAHGVNLICGVNLLSDDEAICLFNRYAFRKGIPISGYEKLFEEVLRYVAGLPLTIRVLGSFLCGKDEPEWEDALERLKTIPLKETLDILELSYMGLEEDYKEIFLDVACILKGDLKEFAIRVLESCGFNARNGLKVLEQKSLITISSNGYLNMHDRIEEMAQNIVRRSHPNEPYKHSRLWNRREIEDILVNDLGTKATKCIKLSWTILDPTIIMKGLGNMKGLRLLYVFKSFSLRSGISYESSQNLPNGLRYLYWKDYPFTYLTKILQATNLDGIEIASSSLVELWEGGKRKVLNQLRFIQLKSSKLRTLDLGLTPNLETLRMKNCDDLVELHIPVESPKLKAIHISLSKLRTLDIRLTPNLETLIIEDCYNLVELHMPVESPKLKSLYLSISKFHLELITSVKELHVKDDFVERYRPVESRRFKSLNLSHCKLRTLDLGLTPNLETLRINSYDDLVELHMPVESPKLKSIDLSLSKLSTLHLGLIPSLETLRVENCDDLVELYMPVKSPKLESLYLSHCKLRTLDIGLTPNLETLKIEDCYDLVELHMPVESPKLKSLYLSISKLSTLHLGLIPSLETLHVKNCDDLVELHMPVESPKLKSIDLSLSKLSTLHLGLIPSLETLRVENCDNLVELYMPVESPKLESLYLSHCMLRTLDIGLTRNLETLRIKNCDDLVELHMPVESPKLKSLDLSLSKLRTLHLGLIPSLETLRVDNCDDLVELHMLAESPKLESLELSLSKLRTLDLGLTRNLKTLHLKDCYNLVELHAPFACLEKLVNFDLTVCLRFKSCLVSQRFPMDLSLAELWLCMESLETCAFHSDNNLPKFKFKLFYSANPPSLGGNLEKLISFGLCACTDLERFSGSICSLQYLRKLTLKGSIPEVPKDLGQLQCLNELVLSCTKIKYLPDSICMLHSLTILKLESCCHLEKLPKDLGRLDSLTHLYVEECVFLRDLPKSMCEMKRLKYFHLPYCLLVEKLPEEVGRLECLKELNIEGTGITCLPQSIFGLKGLRILGFRWRLESYGFTSVISLQGHSAFCVL